MNFKQLSCIYLCIFILWCVPSFAREFDKDFILKNLKTNRYSIDTEASAVVLHENIYRHIIWTESGFSEKSTVHMIIKIIKSDAAYLGDIHVVYSQDARNSSSNFKGTTYNLDGEKVIESEVGKDDKLKKKIVNNNVVMSFSMPSVKEGSIIDYSYEIVSYFNELTVNWQIQDQYPKLESEFSITFPKSVQFTTISHTRLNSKSFDLEGDAENSTDNFCFVKRDYAESQKTFWIRRNIPGVKKESYVVNRVNQLERLEMQMTGTGGWDRMIQYDNSWNILNKSWWPGFGGMKEKLTEAHSLYKMDLDSLISRDMDAVEKTTIIYKFLRWRLTASDYNVIGRYNLKEAYSNKRGTPSELNLTLVAMLRDAGVDASPIILGATDHVSPIEKMPVFNRIIFIACAVYVDSNLILLDITDKNNPLGALSPHYYNGYSWIMGDKGKGIYLTTDMLREKMITSVKISDFGDSTASVEIIQKLGMIRSAEKRREWTQDKEKSKKKMTEFRKILPEDVSVIESSIDNETNPDAPLVIKQKCILSFDSKTKDFFLPANFVKFFDSNPFREAKRQLIIEFPYGIDYSYHLNIQLPENIAPENVPEPVNLEFDKNGMSYKKMTSYVPELNMLTVNAAFNVDNTAYGTDQYEGIKTFFQKIVDDNNQMIVLKKAMKK